MNKRLPMQGLCLVLATLALSCATIREPAPEPERTVAPATFEPLAHVVPIRAVEGRYLNLYSPDSFAVWVGPEVLALKRAHALPEAESLDPELAEVARYIQDRFIIIECHLASLFGDMSIAYDVVGFRGMEVWLERPDGRRIHPLQVLVGMAADEEQREALKLYRRTNVLVFPREDLWVGRPVVNQDLASVRLVLEGHNTRFSFDWLGVPAGEPGPPPSAEEVRKAVRLGFRGLLERLRELARITS